MHWSWQIIWQIVPLVVLIPFTILVTMIARKIATRYRWRRQLVKEIILEGPSALLAAIPTPQPIYAKSVVLTFPDWDGFAGGVELFSGSETIARFDVPRRGKKLWTYLIPPALKEWRGAIETDISKELTAGELIAKVDGDSHWLKKQSHPSRPVTLKLTVFGKSLPTS